MTRRWRWPGSHQTSAVTQQVLDAGVRDGFEMVNRYFNIQFEETHGSRADVTISVDRSQPYGSAYNWLMRTMWYTSNHIHIGRDMPGTQDSVRRTIMHELTHYFLMPVNYHTWQTQLRGNRVVDIGGANATWTAYDVQQLARRGVVLRSGVTKPWEDTTWWNPPPPPVHPWQNPENQYDVNNDGRVTALDALVVINAIGKGIEVDESEKADFFYDVNGDGNISSVDALQVINELYRGS